MYCVREMQNDKIYLFAFADQNNRRFQYMNIGQNYRAGYATDNIKSNL